MRKLVAALMFVFLASLALVVTTGARRGDAKGNLLYVSPASGSADTTVELTSDDWPPNVEVTFVAAFMDSVNADQLVFSQPIAVQRSNDSGRLDVQVKVSDVMAIVVPPRPGYILFRATSGGVNHATSDAIFILTKDGRRPAGSGEIDLHIRALDGHNPDTAIYAWRGGDEGDFFTPYAGYLRVPLQTTIPWLSDGDYEVAVIGGAVWGSDTVPVDGTSLSEVVAAFCSIGPTCDVPARRLRVAHVTIRDAQPVEATIILGVERSVPVALVPQPGVNDGAMTVFGTLSQSPGALVEGVGISDRGNDVQCGTTRSVPESDTPGGSAFALIVPPSCGAFVLPLHIRVNGVMSDKIFTFGANATVKLCTVCPTFIFPNAGYGTDRGSSWAAIAAVLLASGLLIALGGIALWHDLSVRIPRG